jgi:uncharacterized protein YecE (DUF72 family)
MLHIGTCSWTERTLIQSGEFYPKEAQTAESRLRYYAERFDYKYSDAELKEFLPTIENIDKRAKVTYAMFNNCHGGSAVRNALRLKELVKEQP